MLIFTSLSYKIRLIKVKGVIKQYHRKSSVSQRKNSFKGSYKNHINRIASNLQTAHKNDFYKDCNLISCYP